MMSEPMTDERLADERLADERLAEMRAQVKDNWAWGDPVAAVDDLLAEVERLRAELAGKVTAESEAAEITRGWNDE
jgi:hypothetical protein